MVLGALDDIKALSVSWRFIGQGLAALVVCLSLPDSVRFFPEILPLLLERALLVIGVVWYVNVINFLDGIDWMTVAEIVPMTLGLAGLWGLGAIPDAVGILALALLGAMLGFGVFNKHPAQIFLGDAGSLPVGLLLAFMLIVVAATSKTAAILLALYTIADATLTLGRRAWNREHLLSAHKSHFYQRAVAGGFSVPQVTGCVFLLGLLLAGLAIAAVLAKTVAANLVLLAIGVSATGLVLYVMARGRK
jgi:UDP-N-acetylmuramyl pentapeptide phosphotransferase/UDP-N-acetylglucosamine-1-phosphate transferase